MKYSMAIIGPRETILGFKALGLETVYATESQEVVEKLFSLKREKVAVRGSEESSGSRREVDGESYNKYAIIFIMEEMAKAVTPEDYKKLSVDALPAIIPLPSHLGTTGYGLAKLKKIVEKAVGMDILN